MTVLELESRKALLVREILTDINDEDTFRKLNACFQDLRKERNDLPSLSSGLFKDLVAKATKEDEQGLCISTDELNKDIEAW
ncbi:hypothetical protein [Bacteroides sp. 519]|uniref:hypothetical protein n=1 Tax=Bacteroides sp. 519 TaxID=2302937 RepID=UPI0013D065C9|nr:hypothetical protein [Bacteroides sp. 519]NDV58420.1 hypothetical protein [Bacteroides sp. 519]